MTRGTAHRPDRRVDERCLGGVAAPELSPKMPPYDSVAIGVGSGELSRAARSTKSQFACDVCGDVAHPAVGVVEGHHAQGFQHQIHGALPAVGKRQHCGAVG
jgi:hypothetical protein